MRAIGVGLPPPSYPMTVRWKDAMHCPPRTANKYVVMVDCGHGLCYLSTRSFNQFPVANQTGWLNNSEGERVSHWLDGLKVPTELALEALAPKGASLDIDMPKCEVCGRTDPHQHTMGEIEAFDKRRES